MSQTNRLLFVALVMTAMSYAFQSASAGEMLKQVIIANGGIFESAPPYSDFVTIASYSPDDGSYLVFDTIYVQSVQEVIADSSFAWVTAQDSLVAYNLDTRERIAAAAFPGAYRMAVYRDKLLVTAWFGAQNGIYARLLDKKTLATVHDFVGLSDEAAWPLVVGDFAYVAVPGSWMSDSGRIATLRLDQPGIVSESNFGTRANGISQLYLHGNQLIATCKQGWGSSHGFLLRLNLSNQSVVFDSIPAALGLSLGLIGDSLFLTVDGQVGIWNVATAQFISPAIINHSPAAGGFDPVGKRWYLTETDFFSYGRMKWFNSQGQLVDSVETGISPESIAFDFRKEETGIFTRNLPETFGLYPNPAQSQVTISLKNLSESPVEMRVVNASGELVTQITVPSGVENVSLSLEGWLPGLYFIGLYGKDFFSVKKLVVTE